MYRGNPNRADPDYYCYRLTYNQHYDPEAVWELIQRHAGYISVHPGGQYEFYIHRDYATILVLAFPELTRLWDNDLYTT